MLCSGPDANIFEKNVVVKNDVVGSLVTYNL